MEHHRRRVVAAVALAVALTSGAAGCGSSVTGFRSTSPLPAFDTVAVESTARLEADAGALVVLATGQHTALDADFDLSVAVRVPVAAPGAERPLGPEDAVRVIVIRSSSEVHAFLVQFLDVTEGAVGWEGGRPVVQLRAASPYGQSARLQQVPPWPEVEMTLRCDTDAAAFSRMAARFQAQCLLDRRPRGPLEQMIRVLRKLDEAADEVERTLDPFADR